MTSSRDPLYAGYRYPADLIRYAVWLYFRFPLSLRMVEEMLAARGIPVTYEAIRQWGLKFGREYANRFRRRAPCRGDKWHLDEVVISIAGKKHWLWRAVDQEGLVLDVLVQSRRDKTNAKRLLRKLLKKQLRAPHVLIADKLKSYAAAKQEIMPGVEHRQHKGPNNRAENSHQPTPRRERIMKRFKSPQQVQRFLSIHDQIGNVSTRRPKRYRRHISFRPRRGLRHLDRGHQHLHGGMIMAMEDTSRNQFVLRHPISNNLTVPYKQKGVSIRVTAFLEPNAFRLAKTLEYEVFLNDTRIYSPQIAGYRTDKPTYVEMAAVEAMLSNAIYDAAALN